MHRGAVLAQALVACQESAGLYRSKREVCDVQESSTAPTIWLPVPALPPSASTLPIARTARQPCEENHHEEVSSPVCAQEGPENKPHLVEWGAVLPWVIVPGQQCTCPDWPEADVRAVEKHRVYSRVTEREVFGWPWGPREAIRGGHGRAPRSGVPEGARALSWLENKSGSQPSHTCAARIAQATKLDTYPGPSPLLHRRAWLFQRSSRAKHPWG